MNQKISKDIENRVQREKEAHDQGLIEKRSFFDKLNIHVEAYSLPEIRNFLHDFMRLAGTGKSILELGSTQWVTWVGKANVNPQSLTCINISEEYLEIGEDRATKSSVKPKFRLMDAHSLEFEDSDFDLVFGNGILHHLDFVTALDEIARVLKPNGAIVFRECLGINPVLKLGRTLTPGYRTIDEKPLEFEELQELEQRFDLNLYFSDLLTVPAGLISALLFKDQQNFLTSLAFHLDRFIIDNIPGLKYWCKSITIMGRKKAHHATSA